MKQLKYIYLCGFLMTSMSGAMELSKITEGPITAFPEPINRFAITPDGEWLATSEKETLGGRIIVCLRIWKKKESSEEYEETQSGIVLSPPSVRDIGLHWLTDKRRIAVLGWAGLKAVSIATHDASTLKAATVMDDEQKSESAKIDRFYSMHGEDPGAFTESKGVSFVNVPMGTCEAVNEWVQVTPTTIRWQRVALRR